MTQTAENLTFPSKRDTWILLISWVGAGVEVAIGIILLFSNLPALVKVLVPLACLVGAVFMVWVLYGTYYRITQDTLIIRCGPFRFKAPLAEIEAITPTRNPLSSPACSLDRFLIQYRQTHRRIMVSPLDKAGFLQVLVARSPHLKVVGLQAVNKALRIDK
jgi:hypothetical protein